MSRLGHRAFAAKWAGTCAKQGDPIHPGQYIRSVGYGYAHIECIEDAPRVMTPEQRRDEQEYAAGIEDAERWRFNRTMFGDAYADAEEYARDMRGLNGDVW